MSMSVTTPAQAQSCLRREYVSQAECNRRDGDVVSAGPGVVAQVQCNYHGLAQWLLGYGYSISWWEQCGPRELVEEMSEI